VKALKAAGLALLVCGVLGLMYGGFSYTRESHEAKLGPFELTLENTEMVKLPIWAGMATLVAGGLLLLAPRRI